jgi:hypothetical protein
VEYFGEAFVQRLNEEEHLIGQAQEATLLHGVKTDFAEYLNHGGHGVHRLRGRGGNTEKLKI